MSILNNIKLGAFVALYVIAVVITPKSKSKKEVK